MAARGEGRNRTAPPRGIDGSRGQHRGQHDACLGGTSGTPDHATVGVCAARLPSRCAWQEANRHASYSAHTDHRGHPVAVAEVYA